MTKAKTAKSAAEAKKTETETTKPKAKAKSKPITTKGEAKSPATKAGSKTAPKTAAKPEEKPEKKKAAKAAPDASAVVEASEGSGPTAGFSNSGLGIKIASKKPPLSVAPANMILGRQATVKPERTHRPSERRLSKKEQEEIRNFLMEKRERLLAGMRRELAMQKERAGSKAADEVDKATDAYDENLSFEIATANDQELEDILVAIEKIDNGTYGECEVCGCAISPSRLKILPSATTCVSCRGQEEMSRRRDDGQPLFSMMDDEVVETDSM